MLANITVALIVGTAVAGLLLWLGRLFLPRKEDLPRPRLLSELRGADTHVVADLDKICARPLPFRWCGKIHYLEPISTEEFAETAEAMAHVLETFADYKPGITKIETDKVIDLYFEMTHTVCKTIKRTDIAGQPIAKTRALIQLVYDHIMGRLTYDGDEKKKENPSSPVAQRSS